MYIKMVTTIKITCDGVFIQSNSFFTNSHLRTTTSTAPGTTAVTSSNATETHGRSRHVVEQTAMNGVATINATVTRNGRNPFDDDDRSVRDDDVNGSSFPVVEEHQGNLTIVMRNNRRKIDRDLIENLGLGRTGNRRMKGAFMDLKEPWRSNPSEGVEEELYNKVRPKEQKAVAELMRRLAATEHSDISSATTTTGICRPPYHYMYMVRKVASSRGGPPPVVMRDENRSEEAGPVLDGGDNIVARLKGDNTPLSDNVKLNDEGDDETVAAATYGEQRKSRGSDLSDVAAESMGTSPVVDVGQ